MDARRARSDSSWVANGGPRVSGHSRFELYNLHRRPNAGRVNFQVAGRDQQRRVWHGSCRCHRAKRAVGTFRAGNGWIGVFLVKVYLNPNRPCLRADLHPHALSGTRQHRTKHLQQQKKDARQSTCRTQGTVRENVEKLIGGHGESNSVIFSKPYGNLSFGYLTLVRQTDFLLSRLPRPSNRAPSALPAMSQECPKGWTTEVPAQAQSPQIRHCVKLNPAKTN